MNNSFSVNNTVSKIVICAALIILALVSFFPLAKRFPDSKLYDGTVKECTASIDEKTATVLRLTATATVTSAGLSAIPHSVLNGDRAHRLPGNAHFCFEGIEGESLLLLLDEYGVEASSGSACTSGSLDPSHVLLAIGHPHEIAHGSLRLTLSEYTTEEEIDYALSVIPQVVERLRGMSPIWRDKAEGKKPFLLK